MTTRGQRGSTSPMAADPIARPAAAGTVELADARMRISSPPPRTAVEMTRLWKSQNDFHSRLEISHSTRDSHIPTAASLMPIRPKTKTRTRYAAPCHASKGGVRLSAGCRTR
jgi:hypothetical protein